MSNIVIDESRILQLEEDRVTLRNNLREQGIVCADDETIETLLSKMSGIVSWLEICDKSYSGELIDEYGVITTVSEVTFRNMPNVTTISLPSAVSLNESIMGNNSNHFYNDSSLRNLNLPSIATGFKTNALYNVSALKKVCLASAPNGNIGYGYNSYSALDIMDYGLGTTINVTISLCSYLVLRKTDTNTTLSNASYVKDCKVFLPQSMISTYENATNWSATTNVDFIDVVGSRFENKQWLTDMIKYKSKCILDGNEIDVLSDETVAIFKHTENISHCYENGVELQDTDLVKNKTLTSTI